MKYWSQSVHRFLEDHLEMFSIRIEEIIHHFSIERTRPIGIPTIFVSLIFVSNPKKHQLASDDSGSKYLYIENLGSDLVR